MSVLGWRGAAVLPKPFFILRVEGNSSSTITRKRIMSRGASRHHASQASTKFLVLIARNNDTANIPGEKSFHRIR